MRVDCKLAAPCETVPSGQMRSENVQISLRQVKKCLQTGTDCEDSDHSAHAQNIIQAFVPNLYILKYPIILLADSDGPDLGLRCPHMPEDTSLTGGLK